jgi:phosphoribosylanthranilate isomerase
MRRRRERGMTHVKICGFTTVEPMLAAAEAGSDAIGLVFIPGLERTVTADRAEPLIREFRDGLGSTPRPQIIGLFGDQPADEVNDFVARLGLDAVQLCADEGMAYCAEMTVPVFRVVGVNPDVPVSAQLPKIMVLAQRHIMAGHRIVLDAQPVGAYGGTGRRFDWKLAEGLAQAFALGLAGGLTPYNVSEAVATVKPWGVDTSSGVESDGTKDLAKVRAFVEAVRATDKAASRKGLRRFLRRRNA